MIVKATASPVPDHCEDDDSSGDDASVVHSLRCDGFDSGEREDDRNEECPTDTDDVGGPS